MHWVLWIIAILVIVALYFLPTILALLIKRSAWPSILLVNLFLGWSGAGWLLALIWALIGWGDNRIKAL